MVSIKSTELNAVSNIATALAGKIAQLRQTLVDNDRQLAKTERNKKVCGHLYGFAIDGIARKRFTKKYCDLCEQERQLWITRWEILDEMSELNFQLGRELTFLTGDAYIPA